MNTKEIIGISSSEFIRVEQITSSMYKAFSIVYAGVYACSYCIADAIEDCERKVRIMRKKNEIDKLRNSRRYDKRK